MDLIKVSCLIAQAQCLTNWGLTNYLLRAFLQSNHLHKGHLEDRRKWPLWRYGRYGEEGVLHEQYFCREYNMFFLVLSSFLMCPIIMVIQSYITYKKIKYTNSLNYVLNQMLT